MLRTIVVPLLLAVGTLMSAAARAEVRTVVAGDFDVRITQPERLAWRLVKVSWQPLPGTPLEPALLTEATGLAQFGAAGPLTQWALVARERLRAALAPHVEALARGGFAVEPLDAAAWKPGTSVDWKRLSGSEPRAWSEFEAAAASGLAGPGVRVSESYAAHLRQLAYASLGAPPPDGRYTLEGESQGVVGDFPPTTVLVRPDVKAEPLGAFAWAHALGVRRLRTAAASARLLDVALPAPAPGMPRALEATTVGAALDELEATLLGAADAAGLPEGATAGLSAGDKERARKAYEAYVARWRRIADAAKGVIEPGRGEDYRIARRGSAMLGWVVRPVEVAFAEIPRYEIVARAPTQKRKPNLAWGLLTEYAAVPIFAATKDDTKAGDSAALRARLAGKERVDAAVQAATSTK